MRRALLDANPLAQLSVGVACLLSSLFVRDLEVAQVAVGVYAVAAVLFLPTWRYPLVCLALSSLTAVTVFYSTWRLGGHDVEESTTAALRILVLAWPGSVAAGYVDPARLADHLAQSLHLPARFVAALSAALQRFADFLHAWDQLDRTRRARGVGPTRNPFSHVTHLASMAFGLLVHALRGATRTAIAMDARGFATAYDRTWAEPASWTRRDVLVSVAGLLLALPAPILWFLH